MLMRKLYAMIALLAATAMSVSAQSKFTPSARLKMAELQGLEAAQTVEAPRYKTLGHQAPAVKTQMVGVLVGLTPGSSAADIEAAGFEVTTALPTVAVVNVDLDDIESLAELDAVRLIDFGRKIKLHNNMARKNLKVDDVHAGFQYGDQQHSFTGKGVVTAIFDTGLDPNHINFDDADGNTRVKRLFHYYVDSDNNGQLEALLNQTAIRGFETDAVAETHGTHTLGIMAGGYQGECVALDFDYLNVDNEDRGWTQYQDNMPFYGVATESDIVASCGGLYDAFIVDGLDRMISYAKENGEPCVVNLSLGASAGAHDGTDLMSQALTSFADDAVIVISAGNEGDGNYVVEVGENQTVKTTIQPVAVAQNADGSYIYASWGTLDVWSSDGEPVEVTYFHYSKNLFGTAKETNIASYNTVLTEVQRVNTSNNTAFNTAIVDLPTYGFQSYINSISFVDENNGRYNFMSALQFSPNPSANAGYKLGVKITTKPGQTAVVRYVDNDGTGEFAAQDIAGYVDGTPNGTHCNETCAKNVVSVGAYWSRISFGNLLGRGSYYNVSDPTARIDFSSYGKTADGRTVPTVCAPGFTISSYSNHYVNYCDDNNKADSLMSMQGAVPVGNGVYNPYGKMMGTSQAAPCVSGGIALMLEADPGLSSADVIEIIQQTAAQTTESVDNPDKWGAGAFDALAAVKEVLRRKALNSIGSVTADENDRLMLSQNGGNLDIFIAGENSFKVTLFNIGGQAVLTANSYGDQVTVATDGLAKGIYVVSCETAAGRLVRRVAIR